MRVMIAVSVAASLVVIVILAAASPSVAEPLVILDDGRADILGAGDPQTVTLLGEPFGGGASFIKALCLHIDTVDPASDVALMLPSPSGSGYGPAMVIRDFTGDRIPEVFVTASTGGSGGIVNALVVSFDGNRPRVIFDSGTSMKPTFSGIIGEDGTLRLYIEEAQETHLIPLSDRGPSSRDNSSLETGDRKEVEVWGGSYGLLEPVDRDGDGVFELRCIQQVRGASNADRVAEIRSILSWSQGGWEVLETEVVPLGPDGRPVE